MDEIYNKMCEEAWEYLKNKKIDENTPVLLEKKIWTQEELQNFLRNGMLIIHLHEGFVRFIHEHIKNHEYRHDYNSYERMWLAFLMYRIYGRKWNFTTMKWE